ncbi:MAG: STAS domain-containing protein, partial [Comamonas sp.]|nr:STAS domain-containing protein [Comamonas sp.]
LACRRHAQAQGCNLRLQNCPPALQSLAQVYGVDELLGLAA